MEYRVGTTWIIEANVALNSNETCVTMSNSVTLSLSGAGADNLVMDGSTLKVKDGVTGSFEATVVITTVGTDENGEQLSVKYNLTFKQASSTFAIADNANTQDKYGVKFTVGTKHPIKLGTLFTLVGDEPKNIMVRRLINSSGTNMAIDKNGSNDWKEWQITPTGSGENYAIEISNGGETCTLYVRVVSGAYNVGTPDQWKEVPNSASIAVLKNITIPAVNRGAMQAGSGYYSKNIGGGFDCRGNKYIQFLTGVPLYIHGDFNCTRCINIKTLKGGPESVDGNFKCYRCNSLENLIGSPKIVKGYFSCSGCENLKTLQGAPTKVLKNFYCEDCPKLTSMDGISNSLPALFGAYKISKKAVKVGFEWPNVESLKKCIESEFT